MKDLKRFRGILADWMDERTGWRRLWAGYAERSIPGGASWAYVFGSGLKFLFAMQFLTGLLMLLYYVPSIDHAHATVAYIQKEVFLGYLVRSFHFYSANTLFILLLLHLLQTLLWGAYKTRRELVWASGLLMLVLVQGFLFTGYLLPWDQKSYFGTKVALSIVSSIPVLGETLERIAMGGAHLSTLTLSRFFVIHVLVLPLLFLTLLVVHIYLARRAGCAGSLSQEPTSSTYYPSQFLRNTIFIFLLFVGLSFLSHKMPVILEPMADPTDTAYIARPEWYFLPLFQLLKYFPGRLAIIPGLILPGMLMTVLLSLPFFDRSTERSPRRRPIVTAMVFVTGLAFLSLFTMAKFDDYRNEPTMRQLMKQHKQAREFLMEPFQPQSIGKVSVVCPPAPFLENCAECHGDTAEGTKNAPKLIGVTKKYSSDNLIKLLKNPQAYGLSEDMPEFSALPDEELKQIVDYLKAVEKK